MAVGQLTTDGNTTDFIVPKLDSNPGSNWMHLHLSGGFGGGTFQLYFEAESLGFVPINNGDFTAAVDKWIQLKPGTKVRGTLSGSVGATLSYSMR